MVVSAWSRRGARLGLLAALSVGAISAAGAAGAKNPIIALSDGQVSGRVGAEVVEYRAIPYAAPPVGPLRWRPPQLPQPWTGVRDGTAFAPGCAQIDTMGGFAAPSDAEDCLYLNVAAPRRRAGGKLPVLFWIPGGGFFAGSASDYDGSALARRGMVVVTINYRLGVLGFFSHPAIDGEGHGIADYGLMDQQAALRWVRANIARFGGDPDNVTIFGESAGGSSILHNFVSPAARGLFAKAISLSGLVTRVTPLARARAQGNGFAAAMGCASANARADAACLRALPVKDILAHQRPFLTAVIVDGAILPGQPADLLRTGNYAHVPFITGLTAHEKGFVFAEREMHGQPLTADEIPAELGMYPWKPHLGRILPAYPLSRYANASEADIAITQGSMACTQRWIAATASRNAPTFAYEFDADTPSYFPPTSFTMRAFHTSELQYLFPLFHGGQGTVHPLDAAQQKVAAEMLAYVANFARAGDPNGPGLRRWPRYDPVRDEVNALGSGQVLDGYGKRNQCGLWDDILNY